MLEITFSGPGKNCSGTNKNNENGKNWKKAHLALGRSKAFCFRRATYRVQYQII